jgi:hypothetical protein
MIRGPSGWTPTAAGPADPKPRVRVERSSHPCDLSGPIAPLGPVGAWSPPIGPASGPIAGELVDV